MTHYNTGQCVRCIVVSQLLTLSLCLLCAWVGVIIIMEICKAPTLRLKVVNKHNTHNVQRDGKCYQQFTHNVDIKKGSSITVCKMHSHACMHTRTHACTHTHTHTHTHVQTHAYTEWSLAVLHCYPLEFQQPSFYAKPDSLNPTPCLTLCYKQRGTPEEKLS